MINDQVISNESNRSEPFIDYKRILSNAINHWYIVISILLISLTTAFLINRYTDEVFPVNMSVLVRESQEAEGAELLYSNPLINQYRNYLNEVYIIKSYPLINEVIMALNFPISFYKEGNVKTTEVYDGIPINLEIISFNEISENGESPVRFVIKDTSSFVITEADGESNSYNFKQIIKHGRFEYIVKKDSLADLTRFIGGEFIVQFKSPESITRSYINRLEVEWAELGSSVLLLNVNGGIPIKEIDFLNKLVEFYGNQDTEKKTQAAARSIVFIDEQLKYISDSLVRFADRLETFKNKNVLTNLGDEAQRIFLRIDDLEAKKTATSIHNYYLDYLDNYIQSSKNFDEVILPSTVGITDPVLLELVNQLLDTQNQAKLLFGSQTSENPFKSRLLTRISEIRKNINESLKIIRETNQIALDQINNQILTLENQLGNIPTEERKYLILERNYNISENFYVFLTQKRYEAAITKASSVSDIIVINDAMQAGGAIVPKTSQNYVIALVIGLGLPFLILLGLELINNKIQSSEDISRITDIPFIGLIGHVESEEKFIVKDKPKSAIAESFRSIRSNLNYFTDGEDHKLILITSSMSGEGKTFTAINLATVISYSGKKTLIIGSDMRRPRIFDDFNLENKIGLSTYLSGMSTIEESIQTTNIEYLDLLTAGPVPPNPSELLMKPELETLLDWVRKKYDYIIIDTPPVGIVTDAFILSRFADHTLYVTRQNYSPLKALGNINEMYVQERVKNLSLILNDVKNNKPGYGYGYGYGGYYGAYKSNSQLYYDD